MFDADHKLIEWYFDIAKKVGVDNGIPFEDDLYLDMVITPNGQTAPERLRLEAVVIRNLDSAVIGVVTLSPEDFLPDLAIMLYPEYRGLGYSTPVFQFALDYCFEAFNLNEIYAGCYEDNPKSLKMIKNCGFESASETNSHEIHYLTGASRVQSGFIKYKPS